MSCTAGLWNVRKRVSTISKPAHLTFFYSRWLCSFQYEARMFGSCLKSRFRGSKNDRRSKFFLPSHERARVVRRVLEVLQDEESEKAVRSPGFLYRVRYLVILEQVSTIFYIFIKGPLSSTLKRQLKKSISDRLIATKMQAFWKRFCCGACRLRRQ